MKDALVRIAAAKRTRATSLDLGGCGLTELPDELFELTWLEELILSNHIQNYSFKMSKRQFYFYISKGDPNSIKKLPSQIRLLKGIRNLTITGTRGYQLEISDLSPLEDLVNLQNLYLSNTKISDLSPLKDLVNLQMLDISGTKISDLSPLKDLVNLQKLDMSDTEIIDLSSLKGLVNLQYLGISSTQVSDLSPLKGLINLQYLGISSTQVSDLSPLKSLVNLQYLDVSSTQVSDLSTLSALVNLQYLDVSSTRVSDLSTLRALVNLQFLDVSSTQLSDISTLGAVVNLQQLDVSSTRVSDITPLSTLTNLMKLDATSTQISDIGPLKGLINLERLEISSTMVTDLSQLKRIILAGVRIELQNHGILWMSGIYVKDCPLDKALIAAIKKGPKAVIRYFEQPKVPLYEARVLVLGEPRAGKTTLRRKLKSTNEPMPTLQESTKAFEVEIEPYKCSIEKDGEKKSMTYHLWDFGGQDYYRLLHQLFVAEQSVYVIVTDTDRNKNEEEIDFWLETIQRLGKDKNGGYGPVWLLQNPKTNREGSDFLDLKKRYPFWQQNELFVINLNALSEGTEAFNKKELDQFKRFKKSLEHSFCQLDHVGKQMPADWVKVRRALSRHEKENWISTETFYAICTEKGIRNQEERADLLDIFHMLGYVLHYKNTVLDGMVVLKKEWVTDALYRVLDDEIVRKNKGWFRVEDAKKIWFEPQYENRTRELLALMQEFKLSYLNEGSQKYIVPAKLPEDMEGLPEWDAAHNVSLHLQYDWLPRAVPIQLIVTLHDHLVELEHGEQWIWRRGAVLNGRKFDLKDVQVRILENWRENKIEISAKGEHSEVLLRAIMASWRKVHEPFEDKVVVQKQILCACETCQKAIRPFVFEYEDVLNAVEANGDLHCNKSRKGFKGAWIIKGLFDTSIVSLDIFEKQSQVLGKELYSLIAEGNLEEAFIKLTENGANIWALDLMRRFKHSKKAYLQNIITFEEYNQEQSKIVNAMLESLNVMVINKKIIKDNIRKIYFEKPDKPELNFNPTININIQNKNVNVQKTDTSLSNEIADMKAMLAQLSMETQDKLKEFIETLPEPEDENEKESTGKQILKWLNKNAEGITVNVGASVYYDALKAFFGIG